MNIATDLVFALDAVAFARSLAFEPDKWQADMLRFENAQLLLNCARQSGKSTAAALLAVHRALYRPGALILLISPSLRQSSELFRKVREWIAALPSPPRLLEDNQLSCALANGSRIVSLPSSEATVRGFSGVDLIIEDEAARVPDELHMACRPMLAVSGGAMVLMSTPFGKRGHFFEAWTNGGSAWARVEFKATANPRISPEFLAGERATMPEIWYAQEYLCEFRETVDQVFSYDLVMGAISGDVLPLFGEPA